MRKYVVVEDQGECAVFCFGIYDKYHEALGLIMDRIYEFKESYKEDGDEFTISDPYDMDCDCGVAVEITYKAATWSKEGHSVYYILFLD